jgi:hypothetical protein
MPSFNATPEFFTSVEDAVVPILIVHRPRYAIASHAFCNMLKIVHGILLEELGGGRRVSFSGRRICWCSEIVKLVLRYS